MRRLTIFLDDGGVMNDNRRRGPAWQRLVSEFFVPRLGGDPTAWMSANRIVAERQFHDFGLMMRGRTDVDVAAYMRASQIAWVADMCALVGLTPPAEAECLALSEAASAVIPSRVDAAVPGAIAAIRQLHGTGHDLHTASSEWSVELHGYLTGMGVRPCFGGLYGIDLVNTFKEGPLYYERIFADAGVIPAAALVVDDSAAAVAHARAAGARAILVDPTNAAGEGQIISSLADLPAIIDRLEDIRAC